MAEKDTKCAPAFKHYFPRAAQLPIAGMPWRAAGGNFAAVAEVAKTQPVAK